MEKIFVCPYCGQDSYSKNSSKKGKFDTWRAVIKHTSKCAKNDKTFLIDTIYGCIPITEIQNKSIAQAQRQYPGIKLKHFLKRTNLKLEKKYSKKEIINYILLFTDLFKRIPSTRDFDMLEDYPSYPTVRDTFGSWNSAIEAAGFTPNIQNGFGIATLGLDGHLYRSQAEAYLADNYLHGKYTYDIEPQYPKPYGLYYDWYIKELDVYIELDGGLRPERIKYKTQINKRLGRKCLIIPTADIYKKDFMLQNDLSMS